MSKLEGGKRRWSRLPRRKKSFAILRRILLLLLLCGMHSQVETESNPGSSCHTQKIPFLSNVGTVNSTSVKKNFTAVKIGQMTKF